MISQPAFQPAFQPFSSWFFVSVVLDRFFCFFLNGTIQNFDINKTITGNNKGIGCFFLPIPITFMPDSLNRIANLVKSESLETIQNPSTLSEYSKSMASIIIAESDEFFPRYSCIAELV
jgi:hypothetical protein